MTQASDYETVALDTLRLAVSEALERKRRLGQYVVLWRDGKVMCIGPDAPELRYAYRNEAALVPGVTEPKNES